MKSHETPSERGFTLVELLVVMAIIAVLIGISVAGLGFAMRRSRNISRQSAMANLDRSLEAYYSDHQDYPIETDVLTIEGMLDTGGALDPYLEGSWGAPPRTEVYYKSDTDGVFYTVCVSQEEARGGMSWLCTGPGIGETGFPARKIRSDAGVCTDCAGICQIYDGDETGAFSDCGIKSGLGIGG